MPTSREQIKAYVTAREKQEITGLANQAGLSVSELIRRTTLGRQLPDANRHRDVIELVKINADLARLGNLLRMALADEEFVPPGGMDLESLFDTIRETQTALKARILAL